MATERIIIALEGGEGGRRVLADSATDERLSSYSNARRVFWDMKSQAGALEPGEAMTLEVDGNVCLEERFSKRRKGGGAARPAAAPAPAAAHAPATPAATPAAPAPAPALLPAAPPVAPHAPQQTQVSVDQVKAHLRTHAAATTALATNFETMTLGGDGNVEPAEMAQTFKEQAAALEVQALTLPIYPPSPPGLPRTAIPMGAKLYAWAPGTSAVSSSTAMRWLRATVVGGRTVAHGEIRYNVTFAASAGARDPCRDDVPLAEMRLDAVADPSIPYTADAKVHVVWRAEVERMTVFDAATWRNSRGLMVMTYCPKPPMTLTSMQSGSVGHKETKNRMYALLGNHVDWLAEMHRQFPTGVFREKNYKLRASKSKSVLASSEEGIDDSERLLHMEHTTAYFERFAVVVYFGHTEEALNQGVRGTDAFEKMGFGIEYTRKPTFRATPY